MDSLTQLVLGAAVGGAVMGRRAGRRAVAWGAACGTLPDLDVFVPLGSAVADFTYHRSASHSLFVLAALTPLLVWLIRRMHPDTRGHLWGWTALVYLCFLTHVLLDCLTVYGTQIFWPLSSYPVSGSVVFIIDPAYTLPLLVGLGFALARGLRGQRGYRANAIGLALSTAYLAWAGAAKLHVESVARASLTAQGVTEERLLTTPAPFNTLLWRVVAVADGRYLEGYYSLLDDDAQIDFVPHGQGGELLAGLSDHWPVQRLKWFTHGFWAADREGQSIVISDLRMGIEPAYAFRFQVAEVANPHPRPVPNQRVPSERPAAALRWLWQRIWTEQPSAPVPWGGQGS